MATVIKLWVCRTCLKSFVASPDPPVYLSCCCTGPWEAAPQGLPLPYSFQVYVANGRHPQVIRGKEKSEGEIPVPPRSFLVWSLQVGSIPPAKAIACVWQPYAYNSSLQVWQPLISLARSGRGVVAPKVPLHYPYGSFRTFVNILIIKLLSNYVA